VKTFQCFCKYAIHLKCICKQIKRVMGADGSEFIGETVNSQYHGCGCIMYHTNDAQVSKYLFLSLGVSVLVFQCLVPALQ
jgi:hypothetical protein